PVLHAVLLLQRLRRLALQGEIQTARGDVCGRLLRAVPVGCRRLRLAADAARDRAAPAGVRGAVGLRGADPVQFQPAPEAGRLLPAERLAGDPQPPPAGRGLPEGPPAPPAVGGGAAGAGAPGPVPARLRAGQRVVLGGVPGPDAGRAGALRGT